MKTVCQILATYKIFVLLSKFSFPCQILPNDGIIESRGFQVFFRVPCKIFASYEIFASVKFLSVSCQILANYLFTLSCGLDLFYFVSNFRLLLSFLLALRNFRSHETRFRSTPKFDIWRKMCYNKMGENFFPRDGTTLPLPTLLLIYVAPEEVVSHHLREKTREKTIEIFAFFQIFTFFFPTLSSPLVNLFARFVKI